MNFPDIDPVIFSIGPFALRWYALAYVAGVLFGVYYAARLCETKVLWPVTRTNTPPRSRPPSKPMPSKPCGQDLHDFMLWAILGILLGGRLGYVLFYNPAFYWAHPEEILAVWRGGMAFHGGLLGMLVAAWLFARQRNLSLLSLGDVITAAVPIGLGLGRCANFINGELWGRVSDVPWAVIFPHAGALPRHPSQIYEALLEGVLLFVVLRIMTHYVKWLRYPGVVAGSFFAGYALMRIFVELFREPDRHIGFLAGGLTMGMLLSLPIMLFGAALIIYARYVSRRT